MSEMTRLDQLIVQRGLAESRSRAQALVMAGQVLVDGQVALKPGMRVSADADVAIKERLPYVSRGGVKLAAALDAFHMDVSGAVCADVGASTGGFTDCLLQRGAARVYAVDVGYGQLAWTLRHDKRVVVMERTNARYLESLPELVRVVTVDASFISLRLLLPAVVRWLAPQADVVALVKPQFEAGRGQVPRGGVVRDPAVHRQVLEKVADYAAAHRLAVQGLIRSPISGPAGNVEFLMHWQLDSHSNDFDLSEGITHCLTEGQ
jgi:23S rRNA (cytidine1920-2'-O)/16S rRNA (cytidine1409-2'-O)-methyltransferase